MDETATKKILSDTERTTIGTVASKEPAVTGTTSADYYRGDKTFQPLNKSAV